MQKSINKVAFVGDSITAAGHWERTFPGIRGFNFGVNGDCSVDVLPRLEPIVQLKPEKLFLMIGTNDLGRGYDEESIVANVEGILDRLRKELPGCLIHLQSVLPREVDYVNQVRSLNRRYLQLAQERGIPFINLVTPFEGGNGELRRELTDDGLHLVEAGYQLWQAAIERYLK
jgi:lysophospholipase L1-like esterase